MTTENWIEFWKIVLPFLATVIVSGGSGLLLARYQIKKLKADTAAQSAENRKTDAETADIYRQMASSEAENALKKSKTLTDMASKMEIQSNMIDSQQTEINELREDVKREREARTELEAKIAALNIELEKERKERQTAAAELESLKRVSDELSAEHTKKILKLTERVKLLEDELVKHNWPIPNGG